MEQQRVSQRYEETWLAFTEELKSNPTVTLRAICKKLHTNECGMSKWASRHGYSVSRCKASLSQKTSAPSSSFIRIEPKGQPAQHKASMLAGVCITFSSGTTISIKQGDAYLAGVVGNPHRSAKYVVSLCTSWKDAFFGGVQCSDIAFYMCKGQKTFGSVIKKRYFDKQRF